MDSELFLVQRAGKTPLSATRLKRGQLVVGRSSHADICFPNDTVSRRHARIEVASAGITVHDLNSHNGTFVDEQRILTAPVRPGQQLRFGSVNLLLSQNPEGDCGLDSEIKTTEPRDLWRPAPNQSPVPSSLKPAQLRVLELLLKGLLEKQVAEQLGISPHTVHNHAREIYRAYRVHSRTELLLQALPHPIADKAKVGGEFHAALQLGPRKNHRATGTSPVG